jgi:hypothetical protein
MSVVEMTVPALSASRGIGEAKGEALYGGAVRLWFDRRKHAYSVIDEVWGAEPFLAPSVTQILGIIDKSGPLTQWAANSAIDYLRGKIAAGKAYEEGELETAFQEARFNFRKVSKKAQDMGSLVHAWIDAYLLSKLNGTAEPELPAIEQAMNACYAAVAWMDEHRVEPVEPECRIYSRLYRYAGTMDFSAVVDGEPAIVDWKTSAAIYDEYRLQTAAYAEAYGEMSGREVMHRWVVRIGKDDAEFEAVSFSPETLDRDLGAFLAAQALRSRMKEIELERKEQLYGKLRAD